MKADAPFDVGERRPILDFELILAVRTDLHDKRNIGRPALETLYRYTFTVHRTEHRRNFHAARRPDWTGSDFGRPIAPRTDASDVPNPQLTSIGRRERKEGSPVLCAVKSQRLSRVGLWEGAGKLPNMTLEAKALC